MAVRCGSAVCLFLATLMPAAATDLGTLSNNYNWTGFYAGLHAGYGHAGSKVTGDLSASPSGEDFLAGIQAGYNHQRQNWVFGIEGDLNIDFRDTEPVAVPGGGLAAKLDFHATVRGRVGYTFDRFMTYGTAGLAFAGTEATYKGDTQQAKHIGVSAGLGIAAALSDRLMLRAEFLHSNYAAAGYRFGNSSAEMDFHTNIARAGFDVRF